MLKLNLKIKSAIGVALLLINMLFGSVAVYAVDVPTAPTAPSAPTAPDAPAVPVPPTPPSPDQNVVVVPTAPTAPTAPSATTNNSANTSGTGGTATTPTNTSGATNTGNGSGSHNTTNTNQTNDTQIVDVNNADVKNEQVVDVGTGGNTADKNGGSATVQSGDASVSGGLVTDINNNFITIGDLCGMGCSSSFVDENLKNGAGTLNNSNGALTNLVILNNRNNLNLANYSNLGASTGYNQTNKNMGDGTIVSGDADVAFTTINFGNNNGINMDTTNYDIIDTKTDDLWINFPTGTASGSGLGLLGSANIGNGADSQNTANTSSNSSFTIDNNNNLVLNNDVTLYANTGDNTSNKNMGAGNITTGDANVASNIINFLNNNIVSGAKWLLSTVNIFGDMSGDIILPRLADSSGCGCPADLSAANIGNGADSTNSANNSASNSTLVNGVNNATVGNNLNLDANTGGNTADKNMGDSSISTGGTNVDSKLVTVANTNAVGDGDTWWLVLVNNQGQWTGKIVGANDGDTIAGSGLEFGVGPDGTIQALNSGNGADSTNTANNSTTNSTTINNTNNATINNNINIKANTGKNDASENMQGANIKTGDVNVASNIVNFINNNFVGKKFVITIVNIFGKFTGNIIPPDQALPVKGVGGSVSPGSVNLGNQTISSSTGNGSRSHNSSGISSGNSTQTLGGALIAAGNSLGGVTKVASANTDGSVTKVINNPRTGFNFNLILIGLAALVLAGYGVYARKKAS